MENWLFSIFYPIFPDLCHFIQLCKITAFIYNNFFRLGGEAFPSPCGRPWSFFDLHNSFNKRWHSFRRALAHIFTLFYECFRENIPDVGIAKNLPNLLRTLYHLLLLQWERWMATVYPPFAKLNKGLAKGG